MKKVCIFSAQYLPTVGGVERYTYNIARQLHKKGIDVSIVTSKIANLKDFEIQDGIKIYRLPCYNLMNGRFPTVKFNREYHKVMRQLKNQRFDLVITNTRFYVHSLVGVTFGKKYAKRSIVIEHGTSHMSVHNKILDKMEQVFEHGITWLVKLKCKEFYGVSEACLEWLKHFHITGVSTLYNAVDIEEIEKLLERKDNLREKYHIPKDARVIAYTGRLLEEKGVLQLQEAFQTVREQFPNSYLIMAGDGVLYHKLRDRNVKNMILIGQVAFEEVVSLLKIADIFCLPSVSEGMPTSVMEAIACHNFVITTERGGAKEIILDDSYGIILKKNDKELVEKALLRILGDDEYRISATEKCYERLKAEFTWQKVADKIEREFLIYEG